MSIKGPSGNGNINLARGDDNGMPDVKKSAKASDPPAKPKTDYSKVTREVAKST